MLEKVRQWINGKRDYATGVSLYRELNPDPALLRVLERGATDFSTGRLYCALYAICQHLKSNPHVSIQASPTPAATTRLRPDRSIRGPRGDASDKSTGAAASVSPGSASPGKEEIRPAQPAAAAPANPELYTSCKQQADRLYKEVMNDRAVLFSMANAEDLSDPNYPDRIEQRCPVALRVVNGFREVSELYALADHVFVHGKLPEGAAAPDNALEVDTVPDHRVKPTLDNLRKNLNKMRKRPQTPERVALQQVHEANIKKLEERWHSLQQA